MTKNTGGEMRKKVKRKPRVLSMRMAQTCSVSQRREVKVTLPPQSLGKKKKGGSDDNVVR